MVETVGAVVLSAATVLTAWSAFESAKWSGAQATAFSAASASRTESVRASTAAGQQELGDQALFTAWLSASEQGQARVAALIAARFSPELRVAFTKWQDLSPAAAPATPFDLAAYRPGALDRAGQLETRASQEFDTATTDNQRSDDYVLMTVLFSIALFFGAVAGRVRRMQLEYLLTSLGLAVFVISAAITATFPVRF